MGASCSVADASSGVHCIPQGAQLDVVAEHDDGRVHDDEEAISTPSSSEISVGSAQRHIHSNDAAMDLGTTQPLSSPRYVAGSQGTTAITAPRLRENSNDGIQRTVSNTQAMAEGQRTSVSSSRTATTSSPSSSGGNIRRVPQGQGIGSSAGDCPPSGATVEDEYPTFGRSQASRTGHQLLPTEMLQSGSTWDGGLFPGSNGGMRQLTLVHNDTDPLLMLDSIASQRNATHSHHNASGGLELGSASNKRGNHNMHLFGSVASEYPGVNSYSSRRTYGGGGIGSLTSEVSRISGANDVACFDPSRDGTLQPSGGDQTQFSAGGGHHVVTLSSSGRVTKRSENGVVFDPVLKEGGGQVPSSPDAYSSLMVDLPSASGWGVPGQRPVLLNGGRGCGEAVSFGGLDDAQQRSACGDSLQEQQVSSAGLVTVTRASPLNIEM